MSGFNNGLGENVDGGATEFQPGSSASATSLVELSIAGRNLRDMDIFSKSDPMCIVYVQSFGSAGQNNKWQELLRTECIQNTLNPQFTQKVQISYCFEQQQHLKFEMYDISCHSLSTFVDNMSKRLDDHDFIGGATCTLAQIVTAGGGVSGGNGITLALSNPEYGGNCGDLIISVEELLSL